MTHEFPLRLQGDGFNGQTECGVVLLRASETQFHLGLVRAISSNEPVLHLAWHRRLCDEPLTKLIKTFPAAVVALALDPLIDETLQVLASRIAKRHANRPGTIHYGFRDTSASFDQQTGDPTDPDAAFTCATFVLAMFRSVGIRLVDASRWRPPTEEDVNWQRTIGNQLLAWIAEKIHGDLPRAKARIEQDLGSIRYRPTDVAGAALFGREAWPVGASEVDPRATALAAQLPWIGTS